MIHARRPRLIAACVLLAVSGAAHVAANEETAEQPTHQAERSHESHPNNIGVFVGVTAGGEEEGGGKESATGTIGLEYERRLSRWLGIGAVFEFAGGERRDHVGIIAVTFRATPAAKFVVGAGWERSSGTEIFAGDYEPVVRFGFMYEIEVVPGNHISPQINLDRIHGETLAIVGATIGWGF